MPDTSNPEQINWYEHLKPLEDVFGSDLIVMTDGYIDMSATDVNSNVLIEGGINGLTEVDRSNLYPAKLLSTIRRRLGIDQVNSGRPPFIFVGDDQQLEIEFRGIPTDNEALFFIALSMATSERPVERVLEEIREWGGAVLALNNQQDTEPAVEDSEVSKAKENLEIKPGSFAEFCNQLKTHGIETDKHALKELYKSGHTRTTVRQFTRYKHLQGVLRSRSSGNPEGAIRELIEIENSLDENLAVANEIIKNTRVRILLAEHITDPRNERYHKAYPYVPVICPIGSMKPAEKSRLELIVVPKDYASRRQRALAEEFHRASSD